MQTYTLVHDGAPRSVNAGGGGSRKNRYAAHREKMAWERVFGDLLMLAGVPKPLGFTRITVELQFTTKKSRDAENYRHPVVKPLLDAMKKGGWIMDDTEEFVNVERVYLVEGKLEGAGPLVKERMTVIIQAS